MLQNRKPARLIFIGVRDKLLGKKALDFLKMGAVKSELSRTARLREKQNRKRVEEFRKSGDLYTANWAFKHMNPTDVHSFAGHGVCHLSRDARKWASGPCFRQSDTNRTVQS